MSDINASNPPTDDEKSGASKKFIGSAVVVAAIVVLGLVLSLTNTFGSETEPTLNSSAPSPTVSGTPSSTTPAEKSVCGLTDVQMTGTVAAPPTATWTLVGTTAAPSIKDQGPGKTEDDGVRSCYARTPTGSLLAASNLIAMGSQAPLLGKKINERLTVPGPGRDAALAQPPASPDSSGVRIQIAGFRIIRYDGNTADVDIAIRTSTGAVGAQAFTFKWVEGDWKVLLAPNGDLPSKMSQLPSLSGYIAWSGA